VTLARNGRAPRGMAALIALVLAALLGGCANNTVVITHTVTRVRTVVHTRTVTHTVTSATAAPVSPRSGAAGSSTSAGGATAGAATTSGASTADAAGSTSGGYTDAFAAQFTALCLAKVGDRSACGCALRYLEQNVPYAQVVAAEGDLTSGARPSWYDDAVAACL
jgi:hypothetical protein